jgi:hypothetical protein
MPFAGNAVADTRFQDQNGGTLQVKGRLLPAKWRLEWGNWKDSLFWDSLNCQEGPFGDWVGSSSWHRSYIHHNLTVDPSLPQSPKAVSFGLPDALEDGIIDESIEDLSVFLLPIAVPSGDTPLKSLAGITGLILIRSPEMNGSYRRVGRFTELGHFLSDNPFPGGNYGYHPANKGKYWTLLGESELLKSWPGVTEISLV